MSDTTLFLGQTPYFTIPCLLIGKIWTTPFLFRTITNSYPTLNLYRGGGQLCTSFFFSYKYTYTLHHQKIKNKNLDVRQAPRYVKEHKQNANNDWNRAQSLKRLLKTMFLAIKKCTGCTTDVIWVNTKVWSVTSEPTQSSSRPVLSFMDLLVLLTTEWRTSQKWSPSNP